MSKAYISAVSESAPNAQIIFDRFHVQRLVHDALDEVRRAEVRTLEDPPGPQRAEEHSARAAEEPPGTSPFKVTTDCVDAP